MSDQGVTPEVMAQAADALTAIREVANGLRAQLERDGWSPTAAEQVAASFFIATLTGTVGGGRK